MKNVTTLGIDIAKNVFQLCGLNTQGKVVLMRRLTRKKLSEYMANLPICLVAMEACGSANYWARQFSKMGHQVKLISPQYVKPFVRGNKNDYRDAQAIAEAIGRPDMPTVTPKTEEQQDIQCLLRTRSGYIETRVSISNQTRGLLAEYGIVMPKGEKQLRNKLGYLLASDAEEKVSQMLKNTMQRQLDILLMLEEQINECDKELKMLTKSEETCARLMQVDGIGPISAATIVATVGHKGDGFKNGRHFAAYLGLVPRQHSSGERQRLGGISKRGDRYLRGLFVHGARAVVKCVDSKSDSQSCWIKGLIERRGVNRTVVALANKNARIVMAMLLSGADYKLAA